MSSTWAGTPSILGSSDALRMALLTISLSGVQLVWGIEMAYCSPYLLSLGLTKSLMSLVWNVGPISGMICQPIVGVMADRSTSRFGRRRPFIVFGTLAVSFALIVLGWTKEIVGVFFNPQTDFTKTLTIVLAVLSIYLVDFAINAVQACCRALVVDTLPESQQQQGSAWASRMIAIGNIAGYFAGMVDLVGIFGKTFGDTQFKQLMVVSVTILWVCVAITCFSVTERVLLSRGGDAKSGLVDIFRTIWATIFHMPSNIKALCTIMFWAWVGWFPFQVYSTTFVGEVLKRYDDDYKDRLGSPEDVVGAITRVGSMALVLFSCVSLVGSVSLPWMIDSPDAEKLHGTRQLPGRWERLMERFEPYKPDLTTTWMWSEVSFAVLMMATLFVSTVRMATLIVALAGIGWAVMVWAPFSLLGEMVLRLKGEAPRNRQNANTHGTYSPARPVQVEMADLNNSDDTVRYGSADIETAALSGSSSSGDSGELSGIYLGILNIFTCLPQMVGSLVAFAVFSILEPGKSPEFSGDDGLEAPKHGVNAIAVVLGIGGVAALIAAHYIMKLKHINSEYNPL